MSLVKHATQVEVAFSMLLKTQPMGPFVVEEVTTRPAVEGNHLLLYVKLAVAKTTKFSSADITQHALQFESWLVRTCFELFTHRGILVEPKIAFIAAEG